MKNKWRARNETGEVVMLMRDRTKGRRAMTTSPLLKLSTNFDEHTANSCKENAALHSARVHKVLTSNCVELITAAPCCATTKWMRDVMHRREGHVNPLNSSAFVPLPQ